MLTAEQFEKARCFIYRHGDLLARRRFAYHFEDGSKQAVLDCLLCYQNEDGGFGNGIELDVMCPESSGICTEIALGYLLELEVTEGHVFNGILRWVREAALKNGDLPHPAETVKKYPHGEWWEADAGRIMSVAGLLAKAENCPEDVSARASTVFEALHLPFPDELGVYLYPIALYLRYADLHGKHQAWREKLETMFLQMLQKDAWHHPLYFCHDRWGYDGIPDSLWRSEAERAVCTLQDDGGVLIEPYASFPWWRPVWTLDLLVIMKKHKLL